MRNILVAAVVVLLLFFVPIPGVGYLFPAAHNMAYDASDLGSSADPNYQLYKQWRSDRRSAIDQIQTNFSHNYPQVGTDPGQYYKHRSPSAKLAYKFSEAETMLQAEAKGQTVPTNDVVGVSARQARWHDTGKVVFRGQVLEGYGEVKSSYIRHPIGPEGTAAIPSDLAEFKTYVEAVSHSNACPMYSLCGMVVDKNGNGQVFLIGRNGVSPATGRLYIVVNGAYKGPWGSDAELFWRMSDGDFQVRLAE